MIAPKQTLFAQLHSEKFGSPWRELKSEFEALRRKRSEIFEIRRELSMYGQVTAEHDAVFMMQIDEVEERIYECVKSTCMEPAGRFEEIALKAFILLEYLETDEEDIVYFGATRISYDLLELLAAKRLSKRVT